MSTVATLKAIDLLLGGLAVAQQVGELQRQAALENREVTLDDLQPIIEKNDATAKRLLSMRDDD